MLLKKLLDMSTAKERELIQKYHSEQGNKPAVINVTGYRTKNSSGNPVNLDYYKVMTLDFYLWLLDQIKD